MSFIIKFYLNLGEKKIFQVIIITRGRYFAFWKNY